MRKIYIQRDGGVRATAYGAAVEDIRFSAVKKTLLKLPSSVISEARIKIRIPLRKNDYTRFRPLFEA